jgi:hypothetical protein
MVGTTQGNGAEPRPPKKVQRKGPAKTGKAAARAQLVERPELVGNVSAAARLWGVSRSTARAWIADAAMAVPPEPPLVAMAEPPPEVGTSGAIAEPSPVASSPVAAPPSPVAGAMVNPSYDEPFQVEPSLRDEQPRQEAPVAATMVDERPAGEGAPGAMVVPVDTSSTAMAATVTENAVAPLSPIEWRIVERPAWRPIVLSLDAYPPAHPDAQRAHPAHFALRRALGSITPSSATVAYLVAYGLFVVGLTINVTLAISYAPQSSWWHATIMALEGVAIEVLAFRSPS